MSLFGSLHVGTSGLQTSQNALNTTAHNMANVDTIGFTRQKIQFGTRSYNTISVSASAVSYQQIGLGVAYTQTKQVRDIFLDKMYRTQVGRENFYGVWSDATEEVENVFQELEGQAFGEAVKNLWRSTQDLVKDPSNSVDQSVFVQRCSEFLTRASSVYSGLSEYQDNLNYKIKQQVDKINQYGERIGELNQEILKIEAGKIEHANDLKDERNVLLDELSKLASISYSTDPFGNVLVQIEGNNFVNADSYSKMDVHTDELTGFYTPYWKNIAQYITKPDGSQTLDISNAKVFNLKQDVGDEKEIYVGSIKAIMIARGDRRATYEDMINKGTYNSDISPSIVMNVQAQFDQLVNKVTSAINKVLEDAANAEGAYPGSTYMRDENGNPLQMFDLTTNVVDAAGNPKYSIGNLTMNDTLKLTPSLLGFIKPDKNVDYDTAKKLENIFSESVHTLNPNVATKTNLGGYYNNLVIQVGNTGSVMRNIYENQQTTVAATESAREQVSGVSSDEEMSFMIMFQNAYNASSRYINVISQMLEHVVTALGS